MTTITTPHGNVVLAVTQKYSLVSLISLSNEQLLPFFTLFKIQTLSELIKILHTNNLMIHEDILDHTCFYDWLGKTEDNIKTIMTEKGIWLPGMTKYFALKMLLTCHTLVNTIVVPPLVNVVTEPIMIDDNIMIDEMTDPRAKITQGLHYETVPDRDFGIYSKRNIIRKYMVPQYFPDPMVTPINSSILAVLYKLYDEHCFKGQLSELLKKENRTINFSTNLTSQKTAGQHRCQAGCHTISINPIMLNGLFSAGEKNIKSNGLSVGDRLAALMNVFEHELIHLYCSLKNYTRAIKTGPGKMYYAPHGKLFQELAFSFFGHTEYRHSMGHGDIEDQIEKEECQIGMDVYFENEKMGRTYGRIVRCNPKKCKVNTEKGQMYDVPYTMLRLADRDVNVVDVANDKQQCCVGMAVQFNAGTKGILSGNVTKCNPTRVKVRTGLGVFNVPYEQLILG